MRVWVCGSLDVVHVEVEKFGWEIEPCGTPFVQCLVVEGLPLCSVYACLPKRTLASHFFKLGCMLALKIF